MSHRLEGDGSLIYTINLCWNSVTNYLCMPPEMFGEPLRTCRLCPRITKTYTWYQDPSSLALTLSHLASANKYFSHFHL